MKPVLWIYVLLLGLLPWGAFLSETGGFLHYLGDEPPRGQAAYIAMRMVGLFSVVFLFLQAITGVGKSWIQSYVNRPRLNSFHNSLGLVTVLLVVLHPVLFLFGIFLRTGALSPSKLLIPFYANDYYHQMISLGMLAMYFLVLSVIAILLRKVLPRCVYLWIHRLNYLVLPLAFYHTISIGSSTRGWPIITLYALLWGGLAIVVFARVFAVRRPRSERLVQVSPASN